MKYAVPVKLHSCRLLVSLPVHATVLVTSTAVSTKVVQKAYATMPKGSREVPNKFQ